MDFFSESNENKVKDYLGDYYVKDFKYLRPNTSVLKLYKQESDKNVVHQRNRRVTLKLLTKTWLSEVLKGLRQFLYQGSLHGVKYMFEPSFTRGEHATWIAIVLISIVVCASNIFKLFSRWTSSPFVNVIDSLPTPVWAVPFPTIVLCPHLHVMLSRANISELNEVDRFFSSLICPNMHDVKALGTRLQPEQNSFLQDFIIKNSPLCSEMVRNCQWPGQRGNMLGQECCNKLFHPVFTEYGLCFAFNTLPQNGMSNDTLQWQRTFNSHAQPKIIEWDLDAGYPKELPPNLTVSPLRVMGSGEMNGLRLKLFFNITEQQMACDGNTLGFNLLINSPADHVYTSTVLRLPMDRMTTVEVSPLTYKTDPSLRKLSADRRQCFFQNERKLEYYKYYTDSNCRHDMLIREARRQCNCVMFNWPRMDVLEPICSTKNDFNCIEEVRGKVEEQLIYAYYAETEDENQPKDNPLSCHPSCNDVLYASQVYYSDLNKQLEDGEPVPGPKGKIKHGKTTRVNIYFHQSIFLGQHRHAQYDDYYVVGAIGGLLSLFLGFSIISVAELVYFVILRPAAVVIREACTRQLR